VIHNAEFDIAFIEAELERLGGAHEPITASCGILDTLTLARRMHPGQRNSLDALAKRYDVDNSKRELHGALLDAEILAEVYLAMTGGQVSLSLDAEGSDAEDAGLGFAAVARDGLDLAVLKADAGELAAHEAMLARMREQSGGHVVWDTVGAVFNRDS
jgi:DNA polymerase-3 subunit epsilon